MFAPKDVPSDFFPILSREMLIRPIQIRANAEDAAFMIPAASNHSKRHGELRLPLTIMAGAEDGVVDPADHSIRLHRELPDSRLIIVPGCGHMVHYEALDLIADAVARLAGAGAHSMADERNTAAPDPVFTPA
jgi:pimeloyl-ACP methyl ester carboxylesterase